MIGDHRENLVTDKNLLTPNSPRFKLILKNSNMSKEEQSISVRHEEEKLSISEHKDMSFSQKEVFVKI